MIAARSHMSCWLGGTIWSVFRVAGAHVTGSEDMSMTMPTFRSGQLQEEMPVAEDVPFLDCEQSLRFSKDRYMMPRTEQGVLGLWDRVPSSMAWGGGGSSTADVLVYVDNLYLS